MTDKDDTARILAALNAADVAWRKAHPDEPPATEQSIDAQHDRIQWKNGYVQAYLDLVTRE